MRLTQNERVGLIQSAIRKTASTLRISNIDWNTTDEILALIKGKDNQTHDILVAFIEAYSDWFGFHEALERMGKTGKLDPWDIKTLAQKVKTRDETRGVIIESLKQIARP